jgi:predicted Zn-dependent protease
LLPAAEKNPCDLTVRRTLGQALQAVGRAEEAEQHFQFVEEAERELPQLDTCLSEVLEDPGKRFPALQDRHDRAAVPQPSRWRALAEDSSEIDPDHVETHRTLAEYYAAQGDRQAAQRHLQRIVERDSPVDERIRTAANGVGSRFRATSHHMENGLPENDSRPLRRDRQAAQRHLQRIVERDSSR